MISVPHKKLCEPQMLLIILKFLMIFQVNAGVKTPTTLTAHFNNNLDTKYPCAFIDTVNISGSYPTNQPNKPPNNSNNKNNNNNNNNNNVSYIYDWMVIPQDLVAIYDFVIENGIRIPAERHLRACICKLKPCLRFCCAEGYYYDIVNGTCKKLPDIGAKYSAMSLEVSHFVGTNDHNEEAEKPNNNKTKNGQLRVPFNQNSMLVHGSNGSAYFVPTHTHFNVHVDAPCENMRLLKKDQNEIVNWTLYGNGTISYKNHLFPKHYCYTPFKLDNEKWIWQPLACGSDKLPFVLSVREWTYAICLIIAVICMSIILFIYLFCHEIRHTFYGVAIKVYTLCISIGYSLMAHLVLTDPSTMSEIACLYIPCFILLYVVLSFYVLSFTSFNFYLNYHGVSLTKVMFWLLFFPIVCVTVIWSLFVGHTEHNGKPVFGGDTCWFDPRNWSIMIYFYGPIFVACAISIFFYILTLIRITERKESKVNRIKAEIEENRYDSFCKFLTYTLLAWLICVTSFAINYYRGEKSHINYAVCLVIALHGFGSLYALIGKNQQVQNYLRRIEEDIDEEYDETRESTLPMRSLMGD